MKLSDKGRDFIIHQEGEILSVYADQIGVPTAGVGHVTKGLLIGAKITKEQSRAWFSSDIKRFEEGVDQAVKVPLSQTQFDALVSFTFNVGLAAFLGSTLLKRLSDGDYEGAAEQLPRWNKGGGRTLPVLSRRRELERRLFTGQGYGI